MAFVRPIIYVYQEYVNVPTVAPAAPDLNCCLVGPAYHIQDYPTDKTSIVVTPDFIKTGYTKDAACLTNGESSGRPDPGATFVTLTNPPNHIAGGALDTASVDVVMDVALVELGHGNDGVLVVSPESPTFTAVSGDFINQKVAPRDRLVLSDATLAHTVVKYVNSVTDANTIQMTTTSKSSELLGTTNVRWRIEHELVAQHVDSAYYTVVGNAISIRTGAQGLLLAYENILWPTNYGKLYIGYRELRTDLQDIKVLDSTTAIETTIGRIDERNPLAAGAQVAFANTNTNIQVFGVATDDLAGHQGARDKISTREDIYAIVPLTATMSASTFLSCVAMWKSHCVAYSAPEYSKFRIVIGSYPELPTQKSAVQPSLVGSTESVVASAIDVFVDPHASTEFVTKGVDSDNLLDITHADGTPALLTVANGKNIFTTGYTGAKELLGAIGEKRLRTTTALAGATAAERCDYFVRDAILVSEGGTPVTTASACDWTSSDAGATTTISKAGSGAFPTVQAGDVVQVSGGATAAHNNGFLVISKTADTVKVNLAYGADANTGAISVTVYRPIVGVIDATWTNDHTITKTSGFAGAAIGDIAVITPEKDGDTDNVGMWVVTAANDNSITVATDATYKLVDPSTAIMNVAIFRATAAHGVASITTRKRLTRLRDNTAHFLTGGVTAGQLIEIPYPVNANPLHWDTAKTYWIIDDVVSEEILDAAASLGALEELAPKDFIAGFSGDCAYRVAINLDRTSQVTELNTITTSVKNMRAVMVWPNEVLVSSLTNELTGVQNRQSGQYLACAVGGAVAGLPSHQGFTYIGIGGIDQLFNSNFYFTDDQLTNLRNGGWYVFVQDSESSLPYTIHEVTTDVSAYEFGELMNVKNFDYISIFMKAILNEFKGRYNILPETITAIRVSLINGANSLKLRTFPRIGAPLLDASIESVTQPEIDRLDVFMLIDMPKVLNKIGLHLRA